MGRFIAEAINEKIQRESSVKIKRIIASDLDISIRLLRLFNRMDITYLDEISKLTRGEVNYLRNFGTKTKFELEQLMIENNLKFKGE
jgi:c-di-GMP-related signal transduction protein